GGCRGKGAPVATAPCQRRRAAGCWRRRPPHGQLRGQPQGPPMKRSTVNQIIREADAFIRSFGYVLPPFAWWSPEEMRARTAGDSARIRAHFLGWDITDYGQGRFDELGLFLFTVRNGANASL